MLDAMVNEPLDRQLTVAQLRDALSDEHPDAVIGLKSTEGGRTVIRNLRIAPDGTPRAPAFLFQVAEP